MRPTQDIYIMPTHSFNPRICKRCDCGYKSYIDNQSSFNPRICKRCDHTGYDTGTVRFVSIHASVKDATSFWCFSKGFIFCFNPRICKRCDSYGCWYHNWFDVSIHASVKDATSCWSLKTAASRCFNPRICKRCDGYSKRHNHLRMFQSTHL